MTVQQCTLIKCMFSSEKNVGVRPLVMAMHGRRSLSFVAAVVNEYSPVTSQKNF